MVMMLGWFRAEAALASCTNRRLRSGSQLLEDRVMRECLADHAAPLISDLIELYCRALARCSLSTGRRPRGWAGRARRRGASNSSRRAIHTQGATICIVVAAA